MSHVPTSSARSRRTVLSSLGAAGLTFAARRHLAAFAQEASPAGDVPRVGHPINGVWAWNTDLGHNITGTPGIFYPDGAYLEFNIFSGLGLGFWRTTSAQDAEAVVLYQVLAGSWATLAGPVEMFEPGYVPALPEFNEDYIVRFHQTLQVDDAGQALNAFGTWDVVNLVDEATDYSEQLSRIGTRLTAS